MNSRERFMAACRGGNQGRPPAWIMRQAGRYLPEYRALKAKSSFLEMVRTPELAAEVTLQPLRRFPLDAAITFSDILVAPEAMGQPYHFSDGGGIGMDYALDNAGDLRRLDPAGAVERLGYVAAAQRLIRSRLGEEHALLGFCGSPWTLAVYMVEGGSPGEGKKICQWAQRDDEAWRSLMDMLVDVLVGYLKSQIDAGTDAVQIFDSWASLCSDELYQQWSLQWISEVIRRLPAEFPVIVYAKGKGHAASAIVATGATVLGIDHDSEIAEVRRRVGPRPSLQGNLAPEYMSGDAAVAVTQTKRILDSMRGDAGYIFNLGHGILPDARIETVEAVLNEVVSYSEL